MVVEVRQEVKQFIRGLVSIRSVDFRGPWREIVAQINPQLERLRYKEFDPEKPVKVLFGDLNNFSPDRPDSFDPVIIDFLYSGEETPHNVRAVAKLGLQAAYWEELSKVASPSNREHFPYEKWQEFAVQPVFVKGKRYYLKPGDVSLNAFSNIHYAGDGDMIGYAESRVYESGGLSVPFSALGITEELLDRYISLRKKIYECEDKAQKIALLTFRTKKPDIWSFFKSIYPHIDEIVDRTESFSFMYSNIVKAIIKDSMKLDDSIPTTVWPLIQDIGLNLTTFLHNQTRTYFGRELFWNNEFYGSLKGLGELTRQMYETSLASLAQ